GSLGGEKPVARGRDSACLYRDPREDSTPTSGVSPNRDTSRTGSTRGAHGRPGNGGAGARGAGSARSYLENASELEVRPGPQPQLGGHCRRQADVVRGVQPILPCRRQGVRHEREQRPPLVVTQGRDGAARACAQTRVDEVERDAADGVERPFEGDVAPVPT